MRSGSRVFQGAILLMTLLALVPAAREALCAACDPSDCEMNRAVLQTNGTHETNIKITLGVDKEDAAIGDLLQVTFQADRDCWLTLVSLDTAGNIIRLWPNDFSGPDNHVQARAERRFPGPNDTFRYRLTGPSGTERIIAFATSRKDAILSEQDFRAIQTPGFKKYVGHVKTLAIEFERNAAELAASERWGTAQVNLCIREPPPSSAAAQADSGVSLENRDAGKLFVLAVGVSTGKLNYCESDTKKFVEVMQKKAHGGPPDVRTVLARDATHDGFVEGLNWLITRTRPEDSVVVYFNGHGSSIPDQAPLDESDGRDEAFVLHHAKGPGNYREALRKKYIMVDDEFNSFWARIPAGRKALVADCCHSGTIHKRSADADGDIVPKFYPLEGAASPWPGYETRSKAAAAKFGSENEAVLAACADNESAYEIGHLKSSLFTHLLIKAVNAGEPDLRRAFERTRAETLQWVQKAIKERRAKISMQTPSLIDPRNLLKFFTFGR